MRREVRIKDLKVAKAPGPARERPIQKNQDKGVDDGDQEEKPGRRVAEGFVGALSQPAGRARGRRRRRKLIV